MKRIITEIVAFILCLTLLIAGTSYLGYMLMPQRNDFGATWNMYLEEPGDSIDLMFLGSSMVYCDIIPSQIYSDTGVTSYIMSGGTLTTSIGYYFLKEALRTQSPDVVMIEATAVYFNKYEQFTKANIGYMPYSVNRLAATFNAAEPEQRLGLLFPLFNYHDTWEDNSLAYYFNPRPDCKTDINAGYTYLTDIVPMEEKTRREPTLSDEDLEYNFKYLEKTVQLCRDSGIEVQLFLSPTYVCLTDEQRQTIIDRFPDVPLIDFNPVTGDMDIDPSVDYYDTNHLNFTGAVKFSRYLSDYINDNFTFDDSRTHDEELWHNRVMALEEKKAK